MKRTVKMMVAELQRTLAGASIPISELQVALETANKEIHASYSWPWMYKDANILVPAATSTGTISIANGTAAVTGVGTAFPTGQTGYRLKFGQNNIDYIVTSINSATSLTLSQNINLTADQTGIGFLLYKDTFDMPSDFEPGANVYMKNPILRMVIRHIPRYQFEEKMTIMLPFASNVPLYYTDESYNATTERYQIRFCPPLTVVAEYRLSYRARPQDLTSMTQTTALPEGFDEVVLLTAEANLRIAYELPGAQGTMARAAGKLKMLRRMVTTSDIQNRTEAPGFPDSSFSQGGLTILPWGTS